MWGAKLNEDNSKNCESSVGPFENTANKSELDFVTPDWEVKHPFQVLAVSIIQFYLLFAVLWIQTLPRDSLLQNEAISSELEAPFYEAKHAICNKSEVQCRNRSFIVPANGAYSKISTHENLFNWLKSVLAKVYPDGVLGNANEVYAISLEFEKAELVQPNTEEEQYASLLNRNLGKQPWKTKDRWTKVLYPSQQNETEAKKYLEELWEKGWFSSSTVKVSLVLSLFNVHTDIFTEILYAFLQSEEGILKGRKRVESQRNLHITNPTAVISNVYNIFFLIVVSWELTREVIAVINMVMAMKDERVNNSIPYTYINCIIHYFRHRAWILAQKLLKTILLINLLYGMLNVPLKGPSTLSEAINSGTWNASREHSIFPSSDVFLTLAAINLALMIISVLIQLSRVHADFHVILRSVFDLFRRFHCYSFFLLLLLIGWASANHLALGHVHQNFEGILMGLKSCTVSMFGNDFSQFLSSEKLGQFSLISSTLMFVVVLFICHGIVVPLIMASAYPAYSECARTAEKKSDLEEPGTWIKKEFISGCQKQLFCFTPNPIQMVRERIKKNKPQKEVSENQSLLKEYTSNANRGWRDKLSKAVTWKIRLFFAYSLFLCVQTTGIIYSSMSETEKRHFSSTAMFGGSFYSKTRDSPLLSGSMETKKSKKKEKYGRKFSIESMGLYDNTTNVQTMKDLESWIAEVFILRLMNPKFFPERHTIPVHNPLIILFSMSNSLSNGDPFTKDIWPSKITRKRAILGGLYEAELENFATVKRNEKHAVYSEGHDDLQGYSVLKLYYGDPHITLQDYANLELSDKLFTLLTRSISAMWVEYNGDARVHLFNHLDIDIDITGKIESTYKVYAVDELVEKQDSASGMGVSYNYFPLISLRVLYLSTCLLAVYWVMYLWAVAQRHLKYSIVGFLMHLVILAAQIYLLIFLVRNTASVFNPMWTDSDTIDFDNPYPNRSTVPGPNSFQMMSESRGLDFFAPSTRRTWRIVGQLSSVITQREYFSYFSGFALFLAFIQLEFYFVLFDEIFLNRLFSVLYAVRWRIYLLFAFSSLYTIMQFSVSMLCLGSIFPEYSTVPGAWVSLMLDATPRWNYKYLPYNLESRVLPQIMLDFFTIVVWLFIVQGMTLGILLYGIQISQLEIIKSLKLNLFQTWDLSPREDIPIKANRHVIFLWRAVVKALNTKKMQLDIEGEKARHVDNFFSKVMAQPLFKSKFQDSQAMFRREITIYNLLRLQQHLVDILFLKCKRVLVTEDLSRLDEKEKGCTSAVNTRDEYVTSLKNRIEYLKKHLAVIQDNIELEKMDFEMNIRSVEAQRQEEYERRVAEARINHIDSVEHSSQLFKLKQENSLKKRNSAFENE